MSVDGRPLLCNTTKSGDGREFVKWCGLLFDTRTLDIQADYTRYVGAPLATSLTLPLSKASPAPGLLLCMLETFSYIYQQHSDQYPSWSFISTGSRS